MPCQVMSLEMEESEWKIIDGPCSNSPGCILAAILGILAEQLLLLGGADD